MLVTRNADVERYKANEYAGYDGLFDITSLGPDGSEIVRTYSLIITAKRLEGVELLSPDLEAYLKLPLEDSLISCLREYLERRRS